MSDYYISIPLNSDQADRLERIGLNDHIQNMNEEKIIRVGMTRKEQKKIAKGFPDILFDEGNDCIMPQETNDILINLIEEMQTIDIMKVAIMKIYNPLAGKDVFGRGTGCR